MKIKGVFAIAIVVVGVFAVGFYAPQLAQKWEIGVSVKRKVQAYDGQALAREVVPAEGVKLGVKFGDIGPKLVESGALNLEKFKAIYQGANSLTEEQLKVLTEGGGEIVINSSNSHFLLNLFWAFGLANKNQILEEGTMMQGGREKLGNFASTGGWTLAKKDAVEYYSKFEFVTLTPEQQKIVEEVAQGVFRPCCNNSTAFPDCNHGMAALGLAELMASQGYSADQIFKALKSVNSYWFSSQYIELARYFEAKEGKGWADVPARTVLGKEYSSSSGFTDKHNWLLNNNYLPRAGAGGGASCGV